MWLEAEANLRLETRSTGELADPAQLWAGLADLQARVLRAFEPIERAERSLEMFARDVLPALKEIDAAPLQPEAAQAAG